MSAKSNATKAVQTVDRSEKKRFRYGTSSLVLDEAELRRAGIRTYSVEVKSCTNGKWKVLYNTSSEIAPAGERDQTSKK